MNMNLFTSTALAPYASENDYPSVPVHRTYAYTYSTMFAAWCVCGHTAYGIPFSCIASSTTFVIIAFL